MEMGVIYVPVTQCSLADRTFTVIVLAARRYHVDAVWESDSDRIATGCVPTAEPVDGLHWRWRACRSVQLSFYRKSLAVFGNDLRSETAHPRLQWWRRGGLDRPPFFSRATTCVLYILWYCRVLFVWPKYTKLHRFWRYVSKILWVNTPDPNCGYGPLSRLHPTPPTAKQLTRLCPPDSSPRAV